MERLIDIEDIVLLPAKKNVGMTGKMNFLDNDMYPVLTSPLPELVGEYSMDFWIQNNIKPVIPKDSPIEYRLKMCPWSFATFTPDELVAEFVNKDRRNLGTCLRINIDSFNGQDAALFNLAYRLKNLYKDRILLMGGPCGNPETYNFYSQAGFQYMIVGTGKLAEKYGFQYPLGQLLIDLVKFKSTGGIGFPQVKIVVEDSFSNPVNIIKAMALGADHVMVREGFLNLVEAEGTIYTRKKDAEGKETVKEIVDCDSLLNVPTDKLLQGNLVRLYEGRWTPITQHMSDWVRKYQEVCSFAFIMAGATTWAEFKKEIKYGRYFN